MDIRQILNSSPPPIRNDPEPARPRRRIAPNRRTARVPRPKDVPNYTDGLYTVGFVNYPPHEAGDDHILAARHRDFGMIPSGDIATKGIGHTPYSSGRKDFEPKTGRSAFEMFQYKYAYENGDDNDKDWHVLWDYNIGIVRMTPFFKSLRHAKTAPAKSLEANPGLTAISYSITGGSIHCQGYWVPYQAAKALAATFCYHIRWALTPVFGNDFPSLCLAPSHANYQKFLIDPAIVRFCTRETERFRREGMRYKLRASLSSTYPLPSTSPPTHTTVHNTSSPNPPSSDEDTDADYKPEEVKKTKKKKPKFDTTVWTKLRTPPASRTATASPVLQNDPPPLYHPYHHHHARSSSYRDYHHHHHPSSSTTYPDLPIDPGLSTSSSSTPTVTSISIGFLSPQISPRSFAAVSATSWTPINDPHACAFAPLAPSVTTTTTSHAPPCFTSSPPRGVHGGVFPEKRARPVRREVPTSEPALGWKGGGGGGGGGGAASTWEGEECGGEKKRKRFVVDDVDDDGGRGGEGGGGGGSDGSKYHTQEDLDAAEAILQLMAGGQMG